MRDKDEAVGQRKETHFHHHPCRQRTSRVPIEKREKTKVSQPHKRALYNRKKKKD